MYMHERGSGNRVVVLVHGIPGSAGLWDAVAKELATDFRVLIPDLLGFGSSPRPEGIDALWVGPQSEALDAALAEAGADRILLIGHDYGASVCVALSQRPGWSERIDGLGLAATNLFTDTPIPFPIAAVTWPLVGNVAAKALFSRLSLRMVMKQGSTVRLDEGVYLGDSGQVRSIGTIFKHALREIGDRYEFVVPAIEALDAPKFVAWGDNDDFFPLEQGNRAAKAVGAKLTLFEGAGHFLPSERPAELAAEIRRLAEKSGP